MPLCCVPLLLAHRWEAGPGSACMVEVCGQALDGVCDLESKFTGLRVF